MKKIYSVILMILLVCTFAFVGCSSATGLGDNPTTNATVYSNGGTVVLKGDYVYYINGYVDETTLTNPKTDNVMGNVVRGAIYRTKLVNGEISKDEDGFLNSTDLVVSKVVGFSDGGFYIYDDFIYYLTPNMEYGTESGHPLKNDLVEVHKINIDGTNDLRLFTMSNAVDSLNWSTYKVNGVVYVALLDDTTLKIINTSNSNVSTVSDVVSVKFYSQSEYNADTFNNNLAITKEIYFTTNSGAKLNKIDIATGVVTTMASVDSACTYEIVAVMNNAVYYSKIQNLSNSSNTLTKLYYRKTLENGFDNAVEQKLSNVSFDSIYVVENKVSTSTSSSIIGIKDSVIYLVKNNVLSKLCTESSTVLGIYNNQLYYSLDGVVKSLDIYGSLNESGFVDGIIITQDDKTLKLDNTKLFDVSNRFVFVMAEYDGVYYLNYVDLLKETYETRFIGNFVASEIPTQPNQNEYEDDVPEEFKVYVPWID